MPAQLVEPPDQINAGTTVKWTSTFPDYPANDTWTAKFYMMGISQFVSGAGVAGTPSGASFAFVLSIAQTVLTAGAYQWQIRVEKGGEEYVAAAGVTIVAANAEGAAANSGSFAERMVAAIKLRLEQRTTDDIQSLGIAGRAAVKIPWEMLHDKLAYWANQAWIEANPGKRRSMRVRFTGAGNE